MGHVSIKEDTVVSVADGLSIADLNGEAVILSVNTSAYYGLNEVGARAFALARQPRPVREITDLMLLEFEATREQLAEDLLRFFQEMKESGLIETDVAVGDQTAR